MTDADKLKGVSPRWGDLAGNCFPEGHALWGCGAYLLLREAIREKYATAPPGADAWWRPEGAWSRFDVDADRQAELLQGWEGLRRETRIGVESVWDTSPDRRPRGAKRRANQYRARLTDGRWVSGNLLRVFAEMTGWQEVWSGTSRLILLVRAPTLASGRTIVGAVGKIAKLQDSPFPEWKRLWPIREAGP